MDLDQEFGVQGFCLKVFVKEREQGILQNQ